jgi:cytochrome b561
MREVDGQLAPRESERMPSPAACCAGAPGGARYDAATVWLHWVTAAFVTVCWGIAQVTGYFPRGPVRHNVWSVHVALGLLLMLILIARIGWRAAKGRTLPHTGGPLPRQFGSAAKAALYLLMLATMLLGLVNIWVRGWDLFGVVTIPKYDPADTGRETIRAVNSWHDLAANGLMAAAAIHSLAALFRHYVLRDGVLRRMAVT